MKACEKIARLLRTPLVTPDCVTGTPHMESRTPVRSSMLCTPALVRVAQQRPRHGGWFFQTENEDPQPQVVEALGLWIRKRAPCRSSR